MDEIINKTMELIDALDNSKYIKDMLCAKEKLLHDQDLLRVINESHNSSDIELINMRKKVYNNSIYKMYQDNYNELFYIVNKINIMLKDIINNRSCKNENN